jgi:hypothetical protein
MGIIAYRTMIGEVPKADLDVLINMERLGDLMANRAVKDEYM